MKFKLTMKKLIIKKRYRIFLTANNPSAEFSKLITVLSVFVKMIHIIGKRGLAPFPKEEVLTDADLCVQNGCNIYIPYKIKQIFLDIRIDMF